MPDSPRTDDQLLAVATSIARGEGVDWNASQPATATATTALLDELRVIDAVSRLSDPVPDSWGDLSITGELGRGAHGIVYRAVDPTLGIELALKVIRQRRAEDRAAMVSAMNEARYLAQVNHPNVVRVFWAEPVGAEIGIAMELVPGCTLRELIHQRGPLNPREATLIGVDLCHALAAVHGAKLLHGDIKAGNVMRGPGGRTVLMDFGVGHDLKTAGAVGSPHAGTPLYLAPELLAGGQRSKQADIYSVGVLLFYLVTGTYPIDARTASEIEQHYAERRPRRLLRDLRPDLPDAFIQVVERATAERPEDRYRTAGELEAALTPPPKPPARAPLRWRLIVSATGLVLAVAASYVMLVRSDRAATRDQGGGQVAQVPAAAPETAPAPDSYRVDAAFYRRDGSNAVRLPSGARVAPGDELFLQIRSSVPAYVYVINEDDRGETFLLFPLPTQHSSNPLPMGLRHELPGIVRGERTFWRVSSAGEREHFLIFVCPNAPPPAFERMFATLPSPSPDAGIVAQQLPGDSILALRGVGGLSKAPTTSARPRLTDEFATPLPDAEETARGVWVRQLTLQNPRR